MVSVDSSGQAMNQENHYGQLLLVEDDERLAHLTQRYLTEAGYQVSVEVNGLVAGERILAEQPELVILDLMLPGQDGLAVCRQVRPEYKGPILMLTARDASMDEIIGLELGADDYLTKPIAPQILLSRVRAHLRRVREFSRTPESARSAEPEQRTPITDVLQLDKKNREVRCQGQRLTLARPEFDLLAMLLERPGQVLSRNDISLDLRGIEYDGASRHIDILVSGLRAQIGTRDVIKTVHGRGYLLVEYWPGDW